jgi:hypothetical protein
MLRSARALLFADYSSGDAGPGVLSLRLEDQVTFDIAEATLRLDPWSAGGYEVFDWPGGDCIVICGSDAIVALNGSNLALGSSVAMEYEEGETIDAPWFGDAKDCRALIVATEWRVWCLSDRAVVKWVWRCGTTEQDRRICGAPTIGGFRVFVPLRARDGDLIVELSLDDGLQTDERHRDVSRL